eukprot:TRINITY_DN2753_c0_g1_i1.p1 TRINITY_DN2753_c0_g1~~TRINITY_DN2753_c0_g1_i1.p1  ORF type:complete len:425 (-),score=89.32 TRINITY_DN2753_c0_g1_i1:91-1365(-)
MAQQNWTMIIGFTVGLTAGIALVVFVILCFRCHRKRSKLQDSNTTQRSSASLPIRTNGLDASAVLSDNFEAARPSNPNHHSPWWKSRAKSVVPSSSGISRYSYKDLQKATHNFTTILGQGAFGPVYKAVMPTGEAVAVKVLATNSRQGEREFQTEISLLGRLHHRNLVNLLGYCEDKGQYMLVYEYMSNGSLASHLYDKNAHTLSWEERVGIAQDVAHGIEYLHDGAVPSVVHRDIKSANILLDHLMRARVADFGLSKEVKLDARNSTLKGTYGYMDPDYMITRTFTKKSDVYSFGIFLFELITGRNPQHGLMDYINLAAMNIDDKSGWDEIVDEQLVGKCDMEEVRMMATLAYRCVQANPKRRPNMRDISQALAKLKRTKQHSENLSQAFSFVGDRYSEIIGQTEVQITQLNTLPSLRESGDV